MNFNKLQQTSPPPKTEVENLSQPNQRIYLAHLISGIALQTTHCNVVTETVKIMNYHAFCSMCVRHCYIA